MQSTDLDSICSALVYAYILTNTKSPRSPNRLHIPITNIPAADLKLRPELSYVLSEVKCDSQNLITLKDIQDSVSLKARDEKRAESGRPNVILVDHNSITGALKERFGKHVVGCIDHHEDENTIPKNSDVKDDAKEPSPPRIIKPAGSCMSLIIDHCLPTLKDKTNEINVEEVALLAIAPILIDTNNLKDASKTTDLDISVMGFLEETCRSTTQLSSTANRYDRNKYFEAVDAAKSSIESLSISDILRKDYKSWSENDLTLGTAAVVRPISFLLKKAQGGEIFTKEVEKFAEERELDVCAVMTTFNDENGKFCREGYLWAAEGRGTRVVKEFVKKHGKELELEETDENGFKYWKQRNLSASRKQTAPMLRKAMASN